MIAVPKTATKNPAIKNPPMKISIVIFLVRFQLAFYADEPIQYTPEKLPRNEYEQ